LLNLEKLCRVASGGFITLFDYGGAHLSGRPMGNIHAGHDHHDLKEKRLGVSILLNIIVTVAQVIGGWISGSLALLSDALHNFTDVISLIISYIADKLTKKKYTLRETFGYKRAEIIAALINAATLLVIAVMIVQEAITRFRQPVVIELSWVVALAALSILVNGASVLILKPEVSKSMNIASAYLHLFSDMMTSVTVLLGGIVMYFFKIFWLDSLLSILISGYLVYSSCGLLMRTLGILMQFAPPDIDLKAVENEMLKIPAIKSIHHVHLWQLTEKEIHLEAHIDFCENLKLSEVTAVTRYTGQLLRDKFKIQHTILQPEFESDDSEQFIVDES
jgi:cobalt-zinc-cadmium efflux system protein